MDTATILVEDDVTVIVTGSIGPRGREGPAGVPHGGTTGQVLTKTSSVDGAADWEDSGTGVPDGGISGQTLIKQSSTDGDAAWENPSDLLVARSLFTAKGQLLASSAANNPAVVPAGVDGQFVRYDSTAAAGFTAAPLTRPVFPSYLSAGHSWTQLSGEPNGGGGIETNFSHIVGAWCGISSDEVKVWGSSGARGLSISDQATLNQGSGLFMRHHVPPHAEGYVPATSHASSKAAKTLHSLLYTLNDLTPPLGQVGEAGNLLYIIQAAINGLRSMISKAREARLFDSENAVFTYAQGAGASNGWGAQNNGTLSYFPSAGAYHSTVINGNTFTVTLPNWLRPGTLSILFQGGSNGTTTLAAASAGAVSPTTVAVANTTNFGATGAIYAPTTAGVVAATYSSKTSTVFTLDAAGITALTGATLLGTGAMVTRGSPLCQLTSTGTAAAATLTVDDTTLFPPSGSIIVPVVGGKWIKVTYTGKTSTTFTGCTGGSGTLKPAGIVQLNAGALVTFTGTAANASGVRSVNGQGAWGTPCHVVARIPITGSDAGKTIVGTLSGLVTGAQRLTVGGCWLEDEEPPLVVAPTFPRFPFSSYSLASGTSMTAMNQALQNLATYEFDSFVKTPDLDGTWQSLFGATVAADLGAAGASPGTLDVTPTSAANCVIDAGSVLRTAGTAEELTVLSVDKAVVAPNWRLTVLRATSEVSLFNGTNAAHAAGTNLWDCRGIGTDRIHPSEFGHQIVASSIIDSLNATVQTSRQQAGGIIARPRVRIGDGTTVGPNFTGTLAAGTGGSLDTVYAMRVEIPEELTVLQLCMYITNNASTGGVVQMGIYADGGGLPGSIICDGGDLLIDSGSVAREVSITVNQKLRTQWVWFAYAMHVDASANFRGVGSGNYCGPPIRTLVHPAGVFTAPLALSFPSRTSGAGQALPFAAPVQFLGGCTAETSSRPYIFAAVTVPVRD